jgi:hypothetical protein
MVVDWPNNSWNGLCQDASTASTTAAINQLIQGCGTLTEPVGGVLPANAKVLLLTSTNINTSANSFANLNDNLIVLYQCAGNTSGHFANYNILPGLRTLSIAFSGAGGCSDTVTYDRTLLVNQFGAIGGFTFENDGAFVSFDAAGNPTYLNNGCQVLSTGLSLTGGPDVGICPGAGNTATLSGMGTNLVGNPQWLGGTGSFGSPNALTSTYTPGPGDSGIVVLTITGNGACNTTITDTVLVNIVTSMPTVSLSLTVNGTLNSSFSDPGYYYNWFSVGGAGAIPGAYNPSYSPSVNGCYYMVLSTIGSCTSVSDTVCITNVGVNEINGQSVLSVLNNPGHAPSLILQTTGLSGIFNLQVFDIYGRLVSARNLEIQQQVTEVTPDWSDLSSGMYLVRLTNKNLILEEKVVLTGY